ncbi:outer membrane protein assembly factor BamB family protein [Dietzia sp.]|uniref:outer membrane protein assembly factor BamB family protein n=1 Tax=Dietzia sp. TaxID=1871616 RepID=UPI002FD8F3FC
MAKWIERGARRPALAPAFALAGLALAAASITAACSPVTPVLDAHPGQADDWSSTYADLRNSSVAPSGTPDKPDLRWSRDLGAVVPGPGVFTDLGKTIVATLSDSGCNIYNLDLGDGRKDWCVREPIAGSRISTQTNRFGDTYWPALEGAAAVSGEGEHRWGTTPPGVGTTARQLNGQFLLTISNFGGAVVHDTQHGDSRSGTLELAGKAPDMPAEYGLPWCDTGTEGCPVPAQAAISADGTRFYVTVWTPGKDAPELVAGDVATTSRSNPDESASPTDPDAAVELREAWRVPLAHGRTGAPVVLSADGGTAYVAGDSALAAYSTSDGEERWHVDTGIDTDFAPAVSADGTIVVGGRTASFYRGPDGDETDAVTSAALRGSETAVLHDDGDSASETWRARDAASLTAPVLTSSGDVLLASRTKDNGVALRALAGGNGDELWSVPVPAAEGPVAGLTLDTSDTLVLAMSVGRVYAFGTP